MKEIIFRRDIKEGFKVVCRAEGISEALSNTVTRQFNDIVTSVGRSASSKVMEEISYAQFRLDDARTVLGAKYRDPCGSRQSELYHLYITDNAQESAALFAAYPGRRNFFEDFRGRYVEVESLEKMQDEREVSVQNFLDNKPATAILDAVKLLKRTFSEELLAATFEALLDVASADRRGVKILELLGPEEEPAELARHGRWIIEALFACLPSVLALHIGYVCPECNDRGTALVGVRYSSKRAIPNSVRQFAYVCDLVERKFVAPGKPNHAAAGYAALLAKLVFAENCDELLKLNESLNDEELFDAADVPTGIVLRYRLRNDAGAISEEDRRYWLDWHHKAVSASEKGKGSPLMRSKYWGLVDGWLINDMLDRIYAQKNWRDADPIYSRTRIGEIYADAQSLFLQGRPEANRYREYFTRRLKEGNLLNGSQQTASVVDRELIRDFCEQIKRSEDGAFASRCLYWDTMESWFRARWTSGSLMKDRGATDAVKKLYELNPQLGAAYVPVYAVYFRKEDSFSPLTLQQSALGQAAYDIILKEAPSILADRAERELRTRDPFEDQVALGVVLQYRKLMGNEPKLSARYVQICDEILKRKINSFRDVDTERLFQELDRPQGGIIDVFARMNPEGDAHDRLEQRLIQLVFDAGVYLAYPAKPKLAARIAELLDQGKSRRVWTQRLAVLKKVNTLDLNALGDEDFDRLMEEGLGAGTDTVLDEKLKELLWSAIQASFSGGTSNMEHLLMALALHNCYMSGGSFHPKGILKDLEKLEIPAKKLFAFCQHRAEPNSNRGLGYLARIMNAYNTKKRGEDVADSWENYPGEEVRGIHVGMFAGIPMAAAVVSIFLFGGGLAASAICLLKGIGLL